MEDPAQTPLTPGHLIVLTGGMSQAVARIMFEESWKLVAIATSTYTDDKEQSKTDTQFKLFHTGANFYFLLPEIKMKASYANKLVNSMLAKQTFTDFLIFDEMPKTSYAVGSGEATHLYYKTSAVPD